MRIPLFVAVSATLSIAAGPSLALAPCPPSCHLGQGQPIYLADAENLLVRRCDQTQPDKKAKPNRRCSTERLDLEGKVLATLQVPRVMGGDAEFTRQYLDGHTLVQLNWQEAWSKLDKPYALNTLFSGQQLTLTLVGGKLTCAAPAQPAVVRDFGCVPSEVQVFASSSIDKPPRRPVVVVGVCRPDAQTMREVVVTCAAIERAKSAQ